MSQDTLSDVLRGVRLRGAVFFYISGHSEWAAEAPSAKEIAPLLMRGVEHVMEYHAVAQGSCWAGIPDGPCVQLFAGDVVMFPHGDGHVVSSTPGMRANPDLNWFADAKIEQLPLRLAFRGQPGLPSAAPGQPVDAHGHADADATLVCGFLGCDLQPFNPLIAALPRLLHLRATDKDAWIGKFTQQAVAESHAQRPGGEAMLARMSEMMFVDAVRRYADQLPAHSAGWLAGLRDRFVGRALALMHEQLAQDWTLDELGRQVGLSRSAPARALRPVDRRAAHAVSRAVAHAGRRSPLARNTRHRRDDCAGCRLRIRGRLLARLQAPGRPATGRLAARARCGAGLRCRGRFPPEFKEKQADSPLNTGVTSY